ncbi:uncharacterized protein K02A2.6-like [Uranotaenia lowii]|uniref:uncharacterized protein K02A2.6-like n=1 Tax=Uranotaenia lowii TaxID=190385 RepID=UPI0024798FE0|nr:uncharacterized protein K02A2.6-like [Uranotaenia lowii]
MLQQSRRHYVTTAVNHITGVIDSTVLPGTRTVTLAAAEDTSRGFKSACSVIEVLDHIFCRYGYPTQIRCDNVPFNSKAFDDYANKCNVKFSFSSSRYPQSNGLAEKGVAIAKNILKRCLEEVEYQCFQYRLLEYNTTVVASTGMTPAQLFFGRQLKTHLPTTAALLTRSNMNEKNIKKIIEYKRQKQKSYYDRSAKSLPVLSCGETVIFKKNSREWHYGQITRNVNNRSYIIQDDNGSYFRRNRRFIKKSQNRGFDPSEALYEEHLQKALNRNEQKELLEPPVVQQETHCSNRRQAPESSIIPSPEYSIAESPNSSPKCLRTAFS